jgi:hypothetical protein
LLRGARSCAAAVCGRDQTSTECPLAQAGASNIEATGEVYHLNRLQDISGNYAAASAGAAVVDGHTETNMKTQNGVVIKLHARTDGVDLRLSVDGVSLKLTQ